MYVQLCCGFYSLLQISHEPDKLIPGMEIRILYITDEVRIALYSSGFRSPKATVGYKKTGFEPGVVYFIPSQALIWTMGVRVDRAHSCIFFPLEILDWG